MATKAKKSKKKPKGKKRTAAQKRAQKKATAGAKRARRKEKKMAAPKKRKKGKRKAKRRAAAAPVGPWAGAAKPKRRRAKPKKRRAKPKKRRTKRKAARKQTMTVPGTRVKIVKVPQLKTIVVGKTPPARRGKKGKRRKKKLQDNPLANPLALSALGTSAGDGGLFGLLENPAGPLSRDALMGLGTTSLGVGLGLAVATLLDRYVATRTPKDGKHPWYGRDAAAVINSRPDAMRMGVQAGGAVLAMAGAYAMRGRAWIPWLLSGTAIGFGAKLVEQVLNWYLAPALLKVEDWNKPSLGSRLYALEQEDVQKKFGELWAKRAAGQTETDTPVPPINFADTEGMSPILQLGANPWTQHAAQQAQQETPAGKARAVSDGSGHLGRLIPTGRVGACPSCNGKGGCYESCPDLVICNECPGTAARTCEVQVPPGTDIRELAAQADVDIASVSALNDGTPEDYWRVGNTVRLPFALCRYAAARDGGPPADYVPPADFVPPMAEPAIVATAALHRPLSGIDLTSAGVEE